MSKDTIKRLMKYCGSIDDALDLLDEMEVKPKTAKVAEKVKTTPYVAKGRTSKKKVKKALGPISTTILDVVSKTPNITCVECIELAGHKRNPENQSKFSASMSHLTTKKLLIRKMLCKCR